MVQVVLDLDETLVCAYETSSLPPALCTQATEAGLKWFELECISSDKVLSSLQFHQFFFVVVQWILIYVSLIEGM